ncbi:NosY protein [Halobacteriales archaeon QS_8_69_26]|nr:MAG: NosY protein [Halobacteriales archaeon QS_8_69_26]
MSATWRGVARKDVEDAIRSRMVWGLTGIFVVFLTLLLLAFQAQAPAGVDVGTVEALGFVATLAQLFVPLVALVAGYMAIVGERRSGSLRVLLSYPFTRRDVVLGKVVGRSVVIGTALLVAFLVGAAVATLVYGPPAAGSFAGFVAVALLFGLAFSGLAVGVSAATTTRGRAMALSIGTYVGLLFFWRPLVAGLYWAVNGSLPGLRADAWYFLLKRLSPLEAFRVLQSRVLGTEVAEAVGIPVEDVPADATAEQLEIANRVAGEVPFYLQDWFAVVVLVAWGVVPVALGYLRFRDEDI